jgi:hypothetical protein
VGILVHLCWCRITHRFPRNAETRVAPVRCRCISRTNGNRCNIGNGSDCVLGVQTLSFISISWAVSSDVSMVRRHKSSIFSTIETVGIDNALSRFRLLKSAAVLFFAFATHFARLGNMKHSAPHFNLICSICCDTQLRV